MMKKLPLAIYAMVIGAFAVGANEFIVAGVVQEIAGALSVTIGAVGLFESAYAIGVAVAAVAVKVLPEPTEKEAKLKDVDRKGMNGDESRTSERVWSARGAGG